MIFHLNPINFSVISYLILSVIVLFSIVVIRNRTIQTTNSNYVSIKSVIPNDNPNNVLICMSQLTLFRVESFNIFFCYYNYLFYT